MGVELTSESGGWINKETMERKKTEKSGKIKDDLSGQREGC